MAIDIHEAFFLSLKVAASVQPSVPSIVTNSTPSDLVTVTTFDVLFRSSIQLPLENRIVSA